MDQVIAIIITALVMLSGFAIYERLKTFEHRTKDLTARVEKLEQANKLRLPHKAFEEILNGMAALDVHEREVDFDKSLITNARAHFTAALKVGTKREEE